MNIRKKLLLVDDHTLVREGLRALLEREGDIEVVGEANNGREAVQANLKLRPDVVVLDLAMPEMNGFEASREMLKDNPSVKIIGLSSYSDDEFVYQLTQAGAVGFVLKGGATRTLVEAVRGVSSGGVYFSPSITKRLLDDYRREFLDGKSSEVRVKSPSERLTGREREVLQLIAEGHSNKQIAARLCLSVKTIEKHRQQVMNKLNIHDVAGLTRYAISRSIIAVSPQMDCNSRV